MDFSESEITNLRAVAAFFGCALIDDEQASRFTLPVCEAFSLSIRRDYYSRPKARIFPTLPKDLSRSGNVDGINVSLARPALAIAKDIQRRLIPAATKWAQECRDHTARELQATREQTEFLARIFAANRSAVTEYGHHNGWHGKGFGIGRDYAGRNHWGEYAASVRVRSIQALEQIAAICAEDHEFHHRKEEA